MGISRMWGHGLHHSRQKSLVVFEPIVLAWFISLIRQSGSTDTESIDHNQHVFRHIECWERLMINLPNNYPKTLTIGSGTYDQAFFFQWRQCSWNTPQTDTCYFDDVSTLIIVPVEIASNTFLSKSAGFTIFRLWNATNYWFFRYNLTW